jgi:hypothetical protein
VFVMVGQNTSVTLSPDPRLGALRVLSNPVATIGAEIFVNGIRQSQVTPAVVPLLDGNYRITIKKEGYIENTQSVVVREGIENELIFNLQTYHGSQIQLARRHKTYKMLLGAATIASTGIGGYYRLSVMNKARVYQDSKSDATQIYNRMKIHDLYSWIGFGVAVPLGIATLVKSGQQKKVERNIKMAIAPSTDGIILGVSFGL